MEKKRTVLSDITLESDRQFLDRTNITTDIQEVLTQIIENRPEDPVGFLADYFETVAEKTDRVSKAYQQVCLTHHSKPAFHTNVRFAYDLLSQTKISRKTKGLTGKVHSEFLHLLLGDSFPAPIREKLLKKIQCRNHEVVCFEVFKSGVFTCLVLQDFLKEAEALFKSLDGTRSGKVDLVLGEIIIQQLVRAIASTQASQPASVLDGGYVLAPDRLYSSVAHALFNSKGSGNKAVMTSEDFISRAADAFLSKVQALK